MEQAERRRASLVGMQKELVAIRDTCKAVEASRDTAEDAAAPGSDGEGLAVAARAVQYGNPGGVLIGEFTVITVVQGKSLFIPLLEWCSRERVARWPRPGVR